MEETRTFTKREFIKEASEVIAKEELFLRDPLAVLISTALVVVLSKELFDGKTPNTKKEGIENE